MKRAHAACILALLIAACSDPLVDPQTVIGLRILGSKLSADEDATAAQVAPGDSATLSWLVVAEKERSYRAKTVFCDALPGRFGVPRCGTKFLEQDVEGTTGAELSFAFELPEDFSNDQEWLSFLALCEEGEPRWHKSSQRFSCSSEEEPTTAFYHGLWRKEQNHNPSLQDDTLRFDGKTWASTGTEPSCEAEGVVQVSSDEVSAIQLILEGEDSEAFDDPSYGAASAEALTFTHVATTAGLARAFSAVDPEAKNKRFEVEFAGEDAWADVGKQRLGTLYLVVSDGRGGSDWLERSYCITK